MSGVQRPGWHKPYVGCVNWSHEGYPKAVVVFRGKDYFFEAWRDAIRFAVGFGAMVHQSERAS